MQNPKYKKWKLDNLVASRQFGEFASDPFVLALLDKVLQLCTWRWVCVDNRCVALCADVVCGWWPCRCTR